MPGTKSHYLPIMPDQLASFCVECPLGYRNFVILQICEDLALSLQTLEQWSRSGTIMQFGLPSKILTSKAKYPLLFAFGLLMTSCAGGFESIKLDKASNSNNPGDDGDSSARGRDTGGDETDNTNDGDNNNSNDGNKECLSGDPSNQSFSLTVDSVSGANVVFLIDDSGSMANEFAKVGDNLRKFANDISAQAGNNYRIAFVYNKNKLNDSDLQAAIDDVAEVRYAESETWSKWADMGFFRAFAKSSFDQVLPPTIPVDDPTYMGITLDNVKTLADCGANDYFRPRQMPDYWFSPNFNHTSACISPVSHLNLSDYLLSDTVVNIVGISDDDLNTSWDRAGFNPSPSSDQNAYPEMVDLMFKKVLSDGGMRSDYIYHSIVGMNQDDPGVEEYGESHLALSKHTGGSSYDITQADWDPLFNQLREAVIYSEQSVDLSCSASSVKVFIDNIEIDSSLFQVSPDGRRISLLPAAFTGMDSGQVVSIRVEYVNL